MKHKIVSFDTLNKLAEELRSKDKNIVLCHGMFQTMHIGHMRYLRQARNYGDVVIVSIISDRCIEDSKNLKFSEKLRAENVASLGWIDAVIINPFDDVHELIKHLKPNVFIRGFESADSSRDNLEISENEAEFLAALGVKLVITKENEFTSTTQINRYLANLPEDIQKYIELFKERYTIDKLFSTIEGMKDIKVLVIGDMILDEYQYCSAIGKSSKDPTLVLKYDSRDIFIGGAGAVANHVAGFAGSVDLFTVLGERDCHENFIRSNLKENVCPHFIFKTNAPTLIKRRILDGYSMSKLIEVYFMDDSHLGDDQAKIFIDRIQAKLSKYDLVIAADFGHGAINKSVRDLLSVNARFLATNAQSNAGNRGFNTITNYEKSDFVSMAEHEIRLEMRELSGKLFPLMSKIYKRMKCKKLVVTRGRKGCVVLEKNNNFVQIPSFAQKVVDRVGAGDALFALASLAAFRGVSGEVLGFIGNAAGSLAVETMGNQKSIERQILIEYINNLLG